MEKTLLEYGIVGAILLYFLWKDKSTFEMYKNTMQRMADLLEAIQKEQLHPGTKCLGMVFHLQDGKVMSIIIPMPSGLTI